MLRIVFFTLALIFPAAAAMAQTGYRLQPGDTVAIEVTEDSSLNRQALVLPDAARAELAELAVERARVRHNVDTEAAKLRDLFAGGGKQ